MPGSALRSTVMCFPISKTFVAVVEHVEEDMTPVKCEAIFLSCIYSKEIISPHVWTSWPHFMGRLVDFVLARYLMLC